MSTSSPRNISTKTREMLWGRAASRCAFPDCRRELVIDGNAADKASLFGEACHMVAKEPEGPRGDSPLTSKQRDEYDNLLLLCNIHHKVVDDQPNTYPVERLKVMKAEHEQWVRESLQGRSPIWSVPYQRNGLFTGREDLLNTLHDRLTTTKATALTQPQAISGLGGIGKTQIALEYAYSYRDSYHAVFWVRAAISDMLILDYVTIAGLLRLPEKDEQDQNIIVLAVKRWFAENTNWLLILDNADNLETVHDFLPTGSNGHIILTTRASATRGIAALLEVDKMDKEEGMLLLLRCAKVLNPEEPIEHATPEQQTNAKAIVDGLDSLPLALDQAGAFIEETGCNLTEYLAFYQVHRKELLRRRGTLSIDYPESVATTWSLSFQQVEQANPSAAGLLQLFAFLNSDAIPEDIITSGAIHFGTLLSHIAIDAFKLNETLEVLRRYSLIRRNLVTKTLGIHRLVQAVLKDDMTPEIQRLWATRAVQTVEYVFPHEVDAATWSQCERYLPNALTCAALIDHYELVLPEAVRLLSLAASYLADHALYEQAESFVLLTIRLLKQVLELGHPNIAASMNNLAEIYRAQGKYDQAELLYLQALPNNEQMLGLEDIDTAARLDNLGALYTEQGKYDQAEPLLQRALTIYEKVLGPDHPRVAISLSNLAVLYQAQRMHEQTEPLFQRALMIREKAFGPMHPDTGASLNNLASFYYHTQRNYGKAEILYQRALQIVEQMLGPEHPHTAASLDNLAALYAAQGKYEQAEQLLQRSLHIWEKMLGAQHPDTALSLNNLAALYDMQGKYEQSESLYQRVLTIKENVLGAQHPDTVLSLSNLAHLYVNQGRYTEAEPLYQRVLSIYEQVLGPDHPTTATSLNNLASVYNHQGKYVEAEPLYQRALSIFVQTFGLEHPTTVTILKNYIILLRNMKRIEQAEKLEERFKAIQSPKEAEKNDAQS